MVAPKTSNRAPESGDASRIAAFGVRFESQDDFLVEYTDHLRHGEVILPLRDALPVGSPLRLRMHLPDAAVLYLTATVVEVEAQELHFETRACLDELSPEQTRALSLCVDRLVSAESLDPVNEPQLEAQQDVINVLLVDSSVGQRIALGDALRARGMRVRVAENGLLALSAALKRPPDVILTDVEMPQMDGWTLLRSVRQRKRILHIPVVFLTRLSDELSRLRGYQSGVDDYLPKSMPHDEVFARLQGVVARRRRVPSNTDAQGLRGDLEHVRLGSLLSFLEAERRSGALYLRNGAQRAQVRLVDGAFGGVDNLGRFHHPHDRMFDLLSWQFGQFEFLPAPASARSQDASVTPLSYLLMEHARRTDESQVNLEALESVDDLASDEYEA